MAKLVFRLNDVPDQEADDVRALLLEHDIDFYETSAGKWGFSVAGIWLKHNEDTEQARNLIDNYQRQRTEQVRKEFQVLPAGQPPVLRGRLRLWRQETNP